MSARLYDPTLGRFLQTNPGEGGSANDYENVSADPINMMDLTGEGFCLLGKRHGRCRGANKFTDYVQGSDSTKRALDPNYDNPFSNAEDTIAQSTAARYFRSCVSGAAPTAASGAIGGGPAGAAIGAGIGCGINIGGTGAEDLGVRRGVVRRFVFVANGITYSVDLYKGGGGVIRFLLARFG